MKKAVLLFMWPVFMAHAQLPHEKIKFYVNVKGDTIALRQRDYIDVHTHPQLLRIKDSNGKKRVVLPDSVVFLQDIYTWGMCGQKFKVLKYTLLNVETGNGRVCRHYVSEVISHQGISIMESPFCSTCRSLELYISANGRYMATIGKKNFRELIERYFSSYPLLKEHARRKRYSPWRFYKLLQKQKKLLAMP